MGLPASGVVILEVEGGGPAAMAGLRGNQRTVMAGTVELPAGGNVIVAIGGQAISDAEQLNKVVTYDSHLGDRLELVLGLEPEVAIGTGLITEVFGFASGLYAYARQQLIDYRLGLTLLVVTIPAALTGTVLAGVVNSDLLKGILGAGLLLIALVSLEVFTVPAVVIGAQFGSRIARFIPQAALERGLGVLFLPIAALTLFDAYTG